MSDTAALSPLAEKLLLAVAPSGRFAVQIMEFEEDQEGVLLDGNLCPHGDSWDDEAAVGRFQVVVDRIHDELLFGDLYFPEALRGLGYGRTATLRLADIGRDEGCHTMRLTAEQDGRYAWARCGFDFATSDEREVIVTAAAELAQRLGVPFNANAIVQPRDICDLPGAVSRKQLQAADVTREFKAEIVSLGQALLLGPEMTAWSGTLGLAENDPGYVRLRRYVLGR